MAKKFLDATGLQYLWSLIKSKFLSLSGGTVTGTILSTKNSTAASGTNIILGATVATNDQFVFATEATASNAGAGIIATGDDGSEPIYVRQYKGNPITTTSLTTVHQATLLDATGATTFPVSVTAPSFIGALTGNADTATNATNDSNGNLISSEHYVLGTQTAATGTWTGNLTGVKALYNGLTINYWLPYAGSGNATLNLTLDDGTTTGAINCYYQSTTRLTTHIPANAVCTLIYQTVTISDTSYTGWWLDRAYDANNYSNVVQTLTTTNAEYPLLSSATASLAKTATTSTRFAKAVTLNPSTGTITSTVLKGNLDWSYIQNKPTITSGTVTSVKLNDTTYSPTNGVVDLGTITVDVTSLDCGLISES